MKKIFTPNEGKEDRMIRGLLSILFIIASTQFGGLIQIFLAVMGIGLGFTAVTGFCTLYKILGINTCPIKK